MTEPDGNPWKIMLLRANPFVCPIACMEEIS